MASPHPPYIRSKAGGRLIDLDGVLWDSDSESGVSDLKRKSPMRIKIPDLTAFFPTRAEQS